MSEQNGLDMSQFCGAREDLMLSKDQMINLLDSTMKDLDKHLPRDCEDLSDLELTILVAQADIFDVLSALTAANVLTVPPESNN